MLEKKHPTEASKVAPRDTLSCNWLPHKGRDVCSDCCCGRRPIILQTARRIQTCRRVIRKGGGVTGCQQCSKAGGVTRQGTASASRCQYTTSCRHGSTMHESFAHQSPSAPWSVPRAALAEVCSRVQTGRTLPLCHPLVDTSSRQTNGTGGSGLLGALEKDALLQPLPPSVARLVGSFVVGLSSAGLSSAAYPRRLLYKLQLE